MPIKSIKLADQSIIYYMQEFMISIVGLIINILGKIFNNIFKCNGQNRLFYLSFNLPM